MPLPIAAAGAGIFKGMLGGAARAAATGGGRALIGGAVEGAKGAVKGLFNRRQENVQPETPFSGNIAEGMATAVKGAGGGGGSIVPTGGGALVSRKTSAIVKTGGSDILSKFDVLIGAFKRLIEIEEENRKILENQILNFARSSEKDSKSAEQAGQEKTKGKAGKNPIIEGGKKAFKGIFGFIGDLVKAFITYKILDWISKPENTKAIQNTIQFFMNVGKLLGFIGKFVVGPIFNVLTQLVTGQFKVFGEVIEAIISIFSLKWLTNPLEFLKDLLDVPKAIVEMSFNVIKSVIDFMTFGLVSGAADLISNAVKGFFGMGEDKKEETVEQTSSESPQPQKQENPLQKTGNFIKNTVGAVLNPVGAIGNMLGGLFGGNKGSDGTPQLKEGGVVSNNGVKVEPLDSLSKISGVGSYISKTIKMFMSLLTMPFRLVGAALIALVMNTVGKIPGVGPFIKPILQNIISKFDLPSSLASMVLGKSPEKNKEKTKKKSEELKPPKNGSSGGTPPPPAETPPAAGATPENKIGGSVKPLAENANLAKAGDSSVQNVAGTQEDLLKKGFKYVPNTANRFWQDQSGRLYEGKTTGDKTMFGLGQEIYNLKAVTEDQINKGFTAAGNQHTVGSKNDREIQRNLEMFRIINKGGTLEKETTGTALQIKDDKGNWKNKEPKANGGWINGPQSGYPVSLDGGRSTAFIGHGTEWVGFKRAGGGMVSSAFVVPFDTPATRSNGGLVGRRLSEAKSSGYALPFSAGGVVKTDGNWDTGPGYTVKGHTDQQGRPIVFSQPAAKAFAEMITASGGKVKGGDVASSKRSPEKNRSVGGATGSKHMHGIAMDIHGQSNSWIRQHGSKYGWIANDYPGSHGGHFEFKGAGLTPSGTAGAQQQKEDGSKPDQPSQSDSKTSGGAGTGFMGAGASTEDLMYLMKNLGMSSSGQELTDVQSQNIVSQSFAGAGKPGGIKVIAGENKDISSAMESIQSASLGNTLPKDGRWATYSFNL